MSATLDFRTARAFRPLLEPARYKGARGGRGGGKSHFFAELMLEHAILDPNIRQVGIREVLKSIRMSSKQLVEDKIRELNLGYYFEVTQTEIRRHGGQGLIAFMGMQDHTADSIKSLEGFKHAWFDEAQNASARSLEILLPTIRAEGSEVWLSWNPYLPTDPVEKLMVGSERDPRAVTVTVNYTDNPFLPATLREEAERHRERSPGTFGRIWLGHYANEGEEVVIPLSWVMRAVERWRELKALGRFARTPDGRYQDMVGALGVDVADQGEDSTVIAPRMNYWVPELFTYKGRDTMQTADLLAGWFARYPLANQLIDAIGIGAGVVSQARRLKAHAIPFVASESTDRKDRHGILSFRNLRAAAWWNMRDILDPAAGLDVALPDDAELVEEITSPRWVDRNGRIQVESKDPTEHFPDGLKARLGRSPDKATAVIQAFWAPHAQKPKPQTVDNSPKVWKELLAAERGQVRRGPQPITIPTRV